MTETKVQELLRRAVADDDAAAMREGLERMHDRCQTVVIFELDDHGLIARETRYYPRAFEAPGWRSELVEAMN